MSDHVGVSSLVSSGPTPDLMPVIWLASSSICSFTAATSGVTTGTLKISPYGRAMTPKKVVQGFPTDEALPRISRIN